MSEADRGSITPKRVVSHSHHSLRLSRSSEDAKAGHEIIANRQFSLRLRRRLGSRFSFR